VNHVTVKPGLMLVPDWDGTHDFFEDFSVGETRRADEPPMNGAFRASSRLPP
jgi:hypothetical protein